MDGKNNGSFHMVPSLLTTSQGPTNRIGSFTTLTTTCHTRMASRTATHFKIILFCFIIEIVSWEFASYSLCIVIVNNVKV